MSANQSICIDFQSIGDTPKNTINIEKLVDENFEGSCIMKLYHAYLGSTQSITPSVEEIFTKEITTMESYFSESDTKSEKDE